MKNKKGYTLVNFCEFDKYASESYCAIHGVDPDLNLGDITQVNEKEIDDFNMMVFGFPCQPFSVAGKQDGFNDIRGTMFFEAWRILKEKRPKIFIFENVSNLLGHDNEKTIKTILKKIGELDCEITMDLLNSKDFGVPQNRLRLFCIGRLKETGKQ